ncbi:putative nitrogen fixation protein FixT [Lyngbya aestuarii BL J]|uniref:Putative nitrogen fixation protein FixT n=2 Tax=Lyngbya aestuarii TaxID=118322 RepID=U7QMP6_9CYAN|nr:putative nitrogen fixation protein NifT [Lyngbya aestuarii]ERT08537.1 putative nitrogen fixation protein FixT [Lyngbya aestuarii BL J]
MKVMLRKNAAGQLSAYVPKKDLEEDVVEEKMGEEGKIFVLANGWELTFPKLEEPFDLPLTAEAKKL